ncbi:MAG TPA: hypothetical protein VNG12_01225, partial [Acidimicrobiales bacterium]|nr:hypothetical protein [Acidimicrobiales bacterium]
SGATEADHARIEAANRKLSDCDDRLAKYRKAIDAGADPIVVAEWMRDVQGERLRAEQEIGLAQPAGKVTKKQIRELVQSLQEITAALATADPKIKAEVYDELGISVVYDPTRHVAKLEARPQSPWVTVSVGGGTPTRFGGLQPSPLNRVQGRTSCLCRSNRVDRQGRLMPHYGHDALLHCVIEPYPIQHWAPVRLKCGLLLGAERGAAEAGADHQRGERAGRRSVDLHD